MTDFISGPWLVRYGPDEAEVRVLVSGDGTGVQLQCDGYRAQSMAMTALPRLGPRVAVARGVLPASAFLGGRYAIRTAQGQSAWVPIQPDPRPGEPWRFLVLSDHHGHPAARRTLDAIDGDCHGILFAGDAGQDPDRLETWVGKADGAAFIDTMSGPVRDFTAAGEIKAGPMAHAPILATPGNHDVAVTRLDPPTWDVETYTALFAPTDSAAPPGCFAAQIGPLNFLSLLVARRFVPGDHERRTGPCYTMPGRFIFQPPEELARWVAGQERRPGQWHAALLHHSPYSQGHNAHPPFGPPPEYRESLLIRELLPVLEPWADLVVSGHNHAVQHHRVGGTHFLEASQMAFALPASPMGSDSPSARIFAADPAVTCFAWLEIGSSGARVGVRCVDAEGACAEIYRFDLRGI